MSTPPVLLDLLAHSPLYANTPARRIPRLVYYLASFGCVLPLLPVRPLSIHPCFHTFLKLK